MTQINHTRGLRLRRLLAVAVFASATTAGVVIAEEVTLKQSVDVLEDKTAASDLVETAAKSSRLQILGREGKWVHVRTADGKEGYVSQAVLSANTAGGLDLSGLTGGPNASEMSTATAGKGFDDTVEGYAAERHLSKDGLNKMVRYRKAVTGADYKKFVAEGNVGPNHK